MRNQPSRAIRIWPAIFCILASACATESRTSISSVDLDTIVVLNFDTLDAPQWGAAVAFNSRSGSVVVSPASGAGELYLFAADGQLIRKFGRRGRGPEELLGVDGLLFPDSIYALDRGNGRIAVFSPAGEFQRTISARGVERTAAHSAAGDLIVRMPNRRVGDVAAIRIGPSGVAEAFLTHDSAAGTMDGEDAYAHFAADPEGGIWVAGLRRYRIRHYSEEGVETHAYEFQPDWFAVEPKNAERYTDWLDGKAAVDGLSVGSDGLLWVKLGVPETEYPIVDVNFEALDHKAIDLFSDEVIEAIDSDDGRVVAHRRFPYTGLALMPGGYVWMLAERPNGEPHIIVAKLRPHRSSGPDA